MGRQDNTAWSSSTWTPRAASLLFKGPVSNTVTFVDADVSTVNGGWNAEREILQLCPGLSFTFHQPPFKTKSLSFLPPSSCLCPRVSNVDGPQATLCSGAGAGAVKARRPQLRPRRRGPNREQQRGGRKPGPASRQATEAAGGTRGRDSQPALGRARQEGGPTGRRSLPLLLAPVFGGACGYNQKVRPLSAYPNPVILQIRKVRPRDERGLLKSLSVPVAAGPGGRKIYP